MADVDLRGDAWPCTEVNLLDGSGADAVETHEWRLLPPGPKVLMLQTRPASALAADITWDVYLAMANSANGETNKWVELAKDGTDGTEQLFIFTFAEQIMVDVTAYAAGGSGSQIVMNGDYCDAGTVHMYTNLASMVSLLTTIDADTSALASSIAAIDDALPVNAVAMGVRGSAAVPTAMTADGDTTVPWADLYGRLIGYSDDITQGLKMVQDSSALTGIPLQPGAWAQTTAVSNTTGINVVGRKHLGMTVIVGSIGTYVDVRMGATRDGTNWFNANLNQGPTGYTRYTANGNYTLEATNRGYKQIRFEHVAESGATVTCDVTPWANN